MEKITYLPEYYIMRDEIIDKIISLKHDLFDGWDYGEGVAPSKEVIIKSILIYEKTKNFGFNIDVVPKTNGGLILIFCIKDHFVDIAVNPDLTLDLRTEVVIGANYDIGIEVENLNIKRILEVLIETLQKCMSLEHYMSKNMYKQKEDFQATASIPMEEAYQYSTKNVRLSSAQYVCT